MNSTNFIRSFYSALASTVLPHGPQAHSYTNTEYSAGRRVVSLLIREIHRIHFHGPFALAMECTECVGGGWLFNKVYYELEMQQHQRTAAGDELTRLVRMMARQCSLLNFCASPLNAAQAHSPLTRSAQFTRALLITNGASLSRAQRSL